MSEYDHSRPALLTNPCEHGCTLGITEVYEGDYFSDPGCKLADGKTHRLHFATHSVYPVSPLWEADKKKTEELRARAAHAREARKSA